MHKFKIIAPINPGSASVEMDGRRLDGVIGVSFTLSAEGLTRMHLVIIGEIEVEGEFKPETILEVKLQARGHA
jgi:hypothetical protein